MIGSRETRTPAPSLEALVLEEFPEPGPRRRRVFDPAAVDPSALSQHVARARRRAPTPTPTPAPSQNGHVVPDILVEPVTEAYVRGTPIDLPELSAEPRKSRQHMNAKGDRPERRFDTTALHFDKHGRLMSHADYIAHCEKYDYVWRSIKMGDRILDVGCGTDAPLMRAINFVQAQASKVLPANGGCYVGVDLNKLKETKIAWAQLIGEVDMTSDEGYDVCLAAVNRGIDTTRPDPGLMRGYTLIVCLEVIEHMGVEDGKAMLCNMRDLLSPGGRVILSTPVYDGKGQARNHIHEYYIEELKELVESVGFRVAKRMGTFTSEPQLKTWMKAHRPDWYALYMEAREFHSSGYLSGVIAPMVPDIARNNVWVLEKEDDDAD